MPEDNVTGQRPGEHVQVEADLLQAREVAGTVGANHTDAGNGQQQAERPGGGGDRHAFGEQLARDPRAARPSAARIAISGTRPALRASDRPATLAMATSSRHNAAAVSIHSARRGRDPVR